MDERLGERLDERLGDMLGERLVGSMSVKYILLLLYTTALCAKVKAPIVSDHVVVNNKYNSFSPQGRCFKFLGPKAGHCFYQYWLCWTTKSVKQ